MSWGKKVVIEEPFPQTARQSRELQVLQENKFTFDELVELKRLVSMQRNFGYLGPVLEPLRAKIDRLLNEAAEQVLHR